MRKASVFDVASDSASIQSVNRLHTIEHKQLGAVYVIGCQGCIRRAARRTGFASFRINDEFVGSVSLEDAADITNVVHQTRDNEMGIIIRWGWRKQSPAFHD